MKKILQLAKTLKKANTKSMADCLTKGTGLKMTDEMLSLILTILGCGLFAFAGLKFPLFENVVGSPAAACSTLNLFCILPAIILTLPALVTGLYMSDDFGTLMTMPYTMPQIIAAKIISVADGMLHICLVCTVPFAVTSGIVCKMGPSYFLAAILSGICVPIVILALVTSVLMIVMYFVKGLRNKNSLKWIGAIAACVGMGAYLLACQNSTELVSRMTGIFHTVSKLTWLLPVNITLDALRNGSWIFGVFGTIGITLAVSAVFVLLAKTIYLPAAMSMNEYRGSHKVSASSMKKASARNSVLGAYTMKEINSLRRDPAFLMQGFVAPLLTSGILVFSMVLSPKMSDLIGIESIGHTLPAIGWCTAITLMLTFASAAMCAASTTAISREGEEIQFLKQVPVSMEIILKAKHRAAMLIAGLGSTPIIAIGGAVLVGMGKLPFWCLIYSLVLNICVLTFVVTCSMHHDVKKPNLTWASKEVMIKKAGGIHAVVLDLGGLLGGIVLYVAFLIGKDYAGFLIPVCGCLILGVFAVLAFCRTRNLYKFGCERLATY